MRRYLCIALFALTPLAGYECVEKCAEHLPLSGGLYALSLQAEQETKWGHRGSGTLLDRARHELSESQRFYALAGSHLLGQLRG